MADINVERKGPSIWPWIIGLLVLALLIWAIAEMVDTDDEFNEVAQVEQPELTQEPAAVPAPAPVTPGAEAGAVGLGTLLPLGPEDRGQPVEVEGEVVGTPTPQGIWVNAEEDNVVFVEAPIHTRDGGVLETADVSSGDDVDVIGVVKDIPQGQAVTWIDQAELRNSDDFGSWNVHQDLMIAGAPQGMQAAPGQQPGMQQPSGAQQGQGMQANPGDTVKGRY